MKLLKIKIYNNFERNQIYETEKKTFPCTTTKK